MSVTLEDEQSYLLGEKDHLLFTVQEQKLTIDTGGTWRITEQKLLNEKKEPEAAAKTVAFI